MALINLKDACLNYQVMGLKSQSLRKKFLSFATGGHVNTDSSDVAIINALRNINLNIISGDRVGLIGGNGAGKTSLLKLISGIYTLTHGSIEIEGSMSSLVDVNFGIDPEATGRENILFRCLLMGYSLERIKELESEIIEFSGLGDYIDLPTSSYSSGMNVRLAFSMSTFVNSDIVLMDEWLTVGDQNFEQKAGDRLSMIVNRSDILVLASHSVDLIERICNRALLLNKGEIICDGTPRDVIEEYKRIYV
jgi:lipopolysaccharide transport system ATP-binding protein